MVKILFNEKRIFLVNNLIDATASIYLTNAYILFNFNQNKAKSIIDILMLSDIKNIFIIGDVSTHLTIFENTFLHIKAAGGVVMNNKMEMLFIYRRNKWDLPKGKIDTGETPQQCAVREVKEETGIKYVTISQKLIDTYHMYLDNEIIFKTTHWYLMLSNDRYFFPQKEEGIKKAGWIHINNLQYQYDRTYESVRDLINYTIRNSTH